MECDTYLKIWTHKSLESCSCYRVFENNVLSEYTQCWLGILSSLCLDWIKIQDPRLDQDRICFISEIAEDSSACNTGQIGKGFPQQKIPLRVTKRKKFTGTKICKLNFTPGKLGKTLALTLNKKGYIWKINVDNSIKLGCANLLKKRLNISRTCAYLSQRFYLNLPIFYIRIYPSFFLFQMFPLSIFYSLISCFKRFWGR